MNINLNKSLISNFQNNLLIESEKKLNNYFDVKELNFENKNEIMFLTYDEYSKLIIIFFQNEIKIYNKYGNILKKKVNMKNEKKIIKSIINLELTYLFIQIENNNNKLCICIDIENKTYLYVFKNFENLLGLFFIDNVTVCFIFVDKFQIYKINKEINEIFLLKEELKKNNLIKNFIYIHKYKLLFIERDDYLFDVYNFNKDEFYEKKIEKNNIILNEKILKYFKPAKKHFFSLFQTNEKQNNINLILNMHKNNNLFYNKSQYYFKSIYNKLYLIYLSYEDKILYIKKIKNLYKLNDSKNLIKINLMEYSNNSTLQIVNNIILIHNFSKKKTLVLDLKLKNKNYNEIKDYIKINDFNYDLTKVQLIIKGSLYELIDINGNKRIFSIKLNLENYLNNFEENKQYLYIPNMLNKNNTKNFVINKIKNILIDYIISNKNNYNDEICIIEKILYIFNQLIIIEKKIEKTANNLINFNINQLKIDEIFLSHFYLLKNQKNKLTQYEIFNIIFKESFNLNIDNFTQNNILNYLIILIIFYQKLVENNIKILPLFENIFFNIFIKLENNYKIKLINIINNIFIFSDEISLYLIENAHKNQFLIQKGFDMLYLKNIYKELFFAYYKHMGFLYAINYLECIYNNNYILFDELKDYLKDLLELNKNDKNLRNTILLLCK